MKKITKTKKISNSEKITVNLTWNDDCNNGHKSFHITGEIRDAKNGSKRDNFITACGCIHDKIEKYFPEFRHMVKWHGMTEDQPLYYIENTMYHARDRDCALYEVGEAVQWDKRLKFVGIPFTFSEPKPNFFEWLDINESFYGVEVEEIPYDGTDDHEHKSRYSLSGFLEYESKGKWYESPFRTKEEAQEFLEALRTVKYDYVKIPIEWCKALEPNLEAARSCAVWPDATLEQLQSKETLMERLPELMAEFKTDIEATGFKF